MHDLMLSCRPTMGIGHHRLADHRGRGATGAIGRGLGAAVLWASALPAQAPATSPEAPVALQVMREVVLHDGASSALAWSRDGRWLASAGESGDLILVDTEAGEVVHHLLAAGGAIGRLAFAPNASLLAVAGTDVSLWSLPEARCVGRWPSASINALAWHPDGRWLAFADGPRSLQILDAATLRPAHAVPVKGTVLAVALAADGERLAVGTVEGYRIVLALPGGETLELRRCGAPVIGVGWTADDRLLHANSRELYGQVPAAGPVRFAASMHGIELLRGGTAVLAYGGGPAVLCGDGTEPVVIDMAGTIAFTSDGERRALASGGELRFDHRDGSRSLPLPHRGHVPPGWLTADGRYLLLERADQRLDLLDLDAETPAPRPLPVRGSVVAMVGGAEFLTGTRTPIGGVWLESWSAAELAEGKVVRRGQRALAPEMDAEPRWSMQPYDRPWPAFSPDGRWFAYAGRGYDRLGERIVWRQPLRHEQWLVVGNDGQQVVAIGGQGKSRELPVSVESRNADGSVHTSIGVARLRAAELSPDSERLMVRGDDWLQVLSLPSLEVQLELTVRGGHAVWLDPTHLLVATAGANAVEVHGVRGLVQRLELAAPVQQLLVAGPAGRALAVLGDRIVVLQFDR